MNIKVRDLLCGSTKCGGMVEIYSTAKMSSWYNSRPIWRGWAGKELPEGLANSPVNYIASNGDALVLEVQAKRLFVDMDGTLCKWKPAENIEDIFERGWFENIPPQENILNAIRTLSRSEYNDVDIFVLSAVPNSSYAVAEKNAWLDRYLPEVSEENRIFVNFEHCSKSQAVPGGILPTDILIDDYSCNLREWESAGGVSVKVYNGVNGTKGTWRGYSVKSSDPTAYLVEDIRNYAANV